MCLYSSRDSMSGMWLNQMHCLCKQWRLHRTVPYGAFALAAACIGRKLNRADTLTSHVHKNKQTKLPPVPCPYLRLHDIDDFPLIVFSTESKKRKNTQFSPITYLRLNEDDDLALLVPLPQYLQQPQEAVALRADLNHLLNVRVHDAAPADLRCSGGRTEDGSTTVQTCFQRSSRFCAMLALTMLRPPICGTQKINAGLGGIHLARAGHMIERCK